MRLSGTGGPPPQGPPGPIGPHGAPGKVELVICGTATKMVGGRRRRVHRCHGRLVSGKVKFRTGGTLARATIARHQVVYATGASVPTASGGRLLVLNTRRRLMPGDHTLSLTRGLGTRWVTRRSRISLG